MCGLWYVISVADFSPLSLLSVTQSHFHELLVHIIFPVSPPGSGRVTPHPNLCFHSQLTLLPYIELQLTLEQQGLGTLTPSIVVENVRILLTPPPNQLLTAYC